MADIDPSAASGITAILGGALTLATVWASKLVMKRMGLDPTTVTEANGTAQKDMLDWQREQLKAEVDRREKAEANAQSYLEKFNEVSLQLARMEAQNDHLQEQMVQMTAQNELLTKQVQALKTTVDQLRSAMTDRDHI